jgi:internalin A
MNLTGVPSEFRERVSVDGRQVSLAGMQLGSVPEWLGNLTALTTLNLNGNHLGSVPEWLGNLTALTSLDLSRNRLGSVPEWLGNLTALTSLDLGGNRLASVPESLGNLTALTELGLSGNELGSVPEWLGNLTALTSLDLGGNRLASVPEWLGNLTALITLTLIGNKLASLPESLGNLTALTTLNVEGNELASVPEWLGNLTALTTLNLDDNHLTSVPEWLGNLTALTGLSLHNNRLASVPESLGNLTALTELYLGMNQLTSVPEWLRNLTALTKLYIFDNQLASVPEWLGNLTALTTLNLNGNQLASVPESLGNLTALTTLNLGDNQLASVPEWLGNLTALTGLSLHNNRLASVPESLGNLTALTTLNLNGNQLASVPESLGNLTALTTLDLSGNQLTALPLRLADLLDGSLQLSLKGNPLADPLFELAQRGTADLAAYLRSLHDAEPQYEAKLLVVGEGNVGKTSLIAALRSAPFVDSRPTTHGIEITPLTVPNPSVGKDMTVRGWDFGGQEVYRITHQFFFSRRALYLVAWNARQGQEQDEVEGWLRRIRLRVGRDARALLVATHCAERRPELDYPHLERVFPGMLAGAFETDSRTGLGIDRLRQAIGEEAARLPQMGQLISPRWVAAREDILALGKSEPQIRYEQFAAIGEQHGLSEPETSTLAKLMHDLGLVIYYSDDEGLRDVVVLNPEWLTKAISYVLEDEATRHDGGILGHARLRRIWAGRADGYEARYHPYFLRLMEKFDISYRIEGEETQSLVAQLVPLQRPPLAWRHDSPPPAGVRTLTLLCRMTEPAPGLIPWLTVRHHRDSTGTHWRRGVFLRHRIAAYGSEALIELRGGTELAVQVRAPSPDMYFNVLRDSIEDLITRRWPGLGYRLYIPCPGTAADGSPCPGTFPLDGLLRQREAGQAVAVCMDCPATPDISALLTGFAAPTVSLTAELHEVSSKLTDLTASVTAVQGQAAQIAATIRRVHQIVGTEVTDCPRLFTLERVRPTGITRALVHQDHYRLTLWCEHPGYEHPWDPAAYNLDPPKEWFAQVAPYAMLVFRILQLVVPLTGAISIAAMPSDQQGSAQTHLEVMKAIVADLPAGQENRATDTLPEATGRLTAAEGAALRAIRAIIFEHDQLRVFGGLRRVHAPAGDLLWVCEHHYPDYDPGLPLIH